MRSITDHVGVRRQDGPKLLAVGNIYRAIKDIFLHFFFGRFNNVRHRVAFKWRVRTSVIATEPRDRSTTAVGRKKPARNGPERSGERKFSAFSFGRRAIVKLRGVNADAGKGKENCIPAPRRA